MQINLFVDRKVVALEETTCNSDWNRILFLHWVRTFMMLYIYICVFLKHMLYFKKNVYLKIKKAGCNLQVDVLIDHCQQFQKHWSDPILSHCRWKK